MNKKLAYTLLAINALLIGATHASANEMPKCESVAAQTVHASFGQYLTAGNEIQTISCVNAWSGHSAVEKSCTLTAMNGQKFLVVLASQCDAVVTSLILEK